MENLEQLLKKVEKNFTCKDERQKIEYTYKDNVFEVVTMTRAEKMDFIFSCEENRKNGKAFYEWMKPCIYKSFQLKELAMKAKEEGYIKTYYEIIDYLFEPEDLISIIKFIAEINNMSDFSNEANDFQKK